jgi:hypothetical protein
MRMLALALILFTGTLVIGVSDGAEPAGRKAVVFDAYDGYFVSNKFEEREPTSFVVLTNQAAFEKVFGVAMVMGDKSHRLPANIFDKNMVVAAIHRGKAFVAYDVESIGVTGKTLVVRYRAKSEPNPSAEFSCPLILSVAKGDYDAVQFVENGREIRVVQIQSRSSAAFEIDCKEPGTFTAASQDGRGVLAIRGGRGIGEATIRPGTGAWPEEVIIRAYLGGLESLKISAGNVTLAASVQSHSGNRELLHLERNKTEGPQLEQDSPYWMEVMTRNAEGKAVTGLPPKGGWFEMAVPKALLTGASELKVCWIDFYR